VFELIPFSTPTYWLNFNAHMAVSSGAMMGNVEHAMRPYLAHVEKHRENFEDAKEFAPLKFDGEATFVPGELADAMFAAVPIWCSGWLAEGERLAGTRKSFELQARRGRQEESSREPRCSFAEWSMLLGPEKYRAFDRGRQLCPAELR
jgi:hypothetical protein